MLRIYLSFDKPSYRSNMTVLRDIVRRYGRLPYMIVVDNGKEFHSENFTLFARLYGIHIRYRPPANPRHGAVLERTFGTLNKAYIHNLAGNTKILRNVRQATGKFLPSRLAEWDLEHMYYGIQHWAFEYYDQEPHSALGMGILRDGRHRLRRRSCLWTCLPQAAKAFPPEFTTGRKSLRNYSEF